MYISITTAEETKDSFISLNIRANTTGQNKSTESIHTDDEYTLNQIIITHL